MRSLLVLLVLGAASAAFSAGCSSEEEKDSGSASPRASFKKSGKLQPIYSGFKSESTSSTHINGLIKKFDGENDSLRNEALNEVVDIGKPAVQYLESALKAPSPKIREFCCLALGRISKMPGAFMLDKVVALCDDPEVSVVRAACFAIGNIGTKDQAVAKKVFSLLSSPDPTVRSFAAECLRKIKYWPAIPALIFNHLQTKDDAEEAPDKGAKKPEPAAGAGKAIGAEYTDPLRAYAADALAHITHVDYGIDFQMWKKWWIYNQDFYTSDWER